MYLLYRKPPDSDSPYRGFSRLRYSPRSGLSSEAGFIVSRRVAGRRTRKEEGKVAEKERKNANKEEKRRKHRASWCSWSTLAGADVVQDACDGDTRTALDSLRYDVEWLEEGSRSGVGDVRSSVHTEEREVRGRCLLSSTVGQVAGGGPFCCDDTL